jgi:hypothetical protein
MSELSPARFIYRPDHKIFKKIYMSNEYTLTLARLQDSIKRIPDRLSTPQGEDARSEFASIFGQVIIGHENKEGGLYLALPFQTSLLTDPVLYIVAGGLLVLDHPTRSGASEFAFGDRAHVHDLPRHWSIYENRFPRIISCARKREEIQLSGMLNRLSAYDFRGPFAKEAI